MIYEALTVVALIVGYAALAATWLIIRFRRQVRWPIRAAAEVITSTDLSSLIRQPIATLVDELGTRNFEPVVFTRARRGVVGRNVRWWYRLAFFNRATNDGATVGWWEVVPPKGGFPISVSGIDLNFFRYLADGKYASMERRVADAGRFDGGRWAYDLHADAVSIAAHFEDFDGAHRDAGSRPPPFTSTPEWIASIEADSDRRIQSTLSKSTTVDATGRWYVPSWRSAFLAVFRRRRRRATSAGRGFAVIADETG